MKNARIAAVGVACALWGMGGVGCQSTETMGGDSEEDLQALLRDADLPNLPAIGRVATGPTRAGDGVIQEALVNDAFGQWTFDDCNTGRTNLVDSSFNGNTAFRSIGVTCTDGIRGEAVALAVKEDLVYVPDQPNFTFENGVSVAGWFKPTAVGGTRTLFRKRDKGTSAFALVLNGGKFQFVIDLGGGRAISVTSPKKAKANVFQHVAATYDNQVLRLYVDGTEVTNFPLAGAIPPGPGPLLMGNDGSERRFDGAIDEPIFVGRALSAGEIAELLCFPQPPLITEAPFQSDPTPPGTAATFTITVTNQSSPSCAPLALQLELIPFFGTVTTDPPVFEPTPLAPVPSGTTANFTFTAAADASAEPGPIDIQFEVFDSSFGVFQSGVVVLDVSEPLGCHVSTPREVFIKTVSVVDDPIRTTSTGDPADPRTGAWTFKRLMENLAPTPADAPAMVEAMLQTYTTDETVNGFTVTARPVMQGGILDLWPRTDDGRLDLAQAPFALQAIVNRFDLRNLANGDAGEGRFVFAFTQLGFFPRQATMIFEFKLPATTDADVQGWAQSFHALGALSFSEEYNVALQAITDRFTGRGARPGATNGSALSAIRTNEIDLGDNGLWQMRELSLSPTTGLLGPRTLEQTADLSFNFSDALAGFINANEAAILTDSHVVPDTLDGVPFAAGSIFNDGFTTWNATGITNPEARHHFGLNTCNGCHSTETGTQFLQVFPRFPGSEASLSGFLTGTTVNDPVDGTVRTFNDLARRNADLKAIVCDGNVAKLSRGISRVH